MPEINWLELAFWQHQKNEELERQRRIVLARDLYEGTILEALLTELENSLLSGDITNVPSLFNFYAAVVDEQLDRLRVNDLLDGAHQDAQPVDWARRAWQASEMDERQHWLHRNASVDGEAFLLLAPIQGEEHITIQVLPHQRFTDVDVGGDGEGMMFHFKGEERPGMLPAAASKRWTETILENGETITRQRATLYIAADPITGEGGRIEKYAKDEAGNWVTHMDEGDEGNPIDWPYPFPIIRMRHPSGGPAGRRATGPQHVLDDIITGMIRATNTTSFPPLITIGGYPTIDGQIPAEDGSNVWRFGPGVVIGLPESPDMIKIEVLKPGDLSQVMNSYRELVQAMSITTGAVSLLAHRVGGQPPAARLLRQMDIRPMAKTRRAQSTFGNSYTLMFQLYKRLHNELAEGEGIEPIEDTDPLARVHVHWQAADVIGELQDELPEEEAQEEGATAEENANAAAN